ncbi:MAG: hypothetical protein VX223_15585 [Myxococcota bacterium]|nr:hypothetical protein [Myxococcota bacterium]
MGAETSVAPDDSLGDGPYAYAVRYTLLIFAAALVIVLTYVSPSMGATLGFVACAALLFRRMSAPDAETLSPESSFVDDPISTDLAGPALDWARRELGLPETGDEAPLVLNTTHGRIELATGHRNHAPFVSVKWLVGDETEMTWIMRRKQSLLGLARIVDNTPVHGSRIEYRLRKMALSSPSDTAFDAGTSRPRLFNELLERGLADLIRQHHFDLQYRLEELVFTGTSLTAVYVPAGEPSNSPWATESIKRTLPVIQLMARFLAESHIPSAQS